MGAVAGLVQLGAEPVSRDHLVAMSRALEHRGPDAEALALDRGAGLAARLLDTSGAAPGGAAPLVDRERLVLAADVRLDNRGALQQRLRLPEASDVELLAAAYVEWGESCPQHLIGDFAFAIWDRPARRMVCAVDPIGLRPLYYAHRPGRGFAVASEIKGVRCAPFVSDRVREERVADFAVALPHDGTSTFYADVDRLPAAHCLVVDEQGLRLNRYWSPEAAEPRAGTDEELASAFRDCFLTAVRARLPDRAPVGAMLSGGLDSSSVACAAASLLAAGQIPQAGPVHTLSLVRAEAVGDERPAIEAALRAGTFVHHEIATDELSPLDEVGEMLRHQDEPFEFSNLYLLWRLYSEARQHGLRVVLDGYHGDSVVSLGIAWLPELVRRLRWRRFLSEGLPLTRGVGSRARALWALGGRPLLPRAWKRRRLLRELDGRRRLLGPDLARRTAERHRARVDAMAAVLGAPCERRRHIADVTSAEHFHFLGQVDRAAAAFAVENRSPFYDRRLIELCVSLPPQQKLQRGWTRSVHRRALAGIVPDAILWQRHKTPPAPSLAHALVCRERPRVEALLGSGALGDYLDRERVSDLYGRYLQERTPWRAMMVWRLAMLSLWLETHAR